MTSNVYGVGVVQNEADILGESLEWALHFCARIWLWDIGSTDDTPRVAEGFPANRVTLSRRTGLRFSSSLKGRVFAEARDQIPVGSWIYIFDADEFLEGPLEEAFRRADEQKADKIGVWQANFYPTAADLRRITELGEAQWTQRPVATRLRHYRVEWFEWRLIRTAADFEWDTIGPHSIWRRGGSPLKPCHGEALSVRHYRYRSPQQVEIRHRIRTSSPITGYGQFRYDVSSRFEDFVWPEKRLVVWPPGEPWQIPAAELARARLRVLMLRARKKIGCRWSPTR